VSGWLRIASRKLLRFNVGRLAVIRFPPPLRFTLRATCLPRTTTLRLSDQHVEPRVARLLATRARPLGAFPAYDAIALLSAVAPCLGVWAAQRKYSAPLVRPGKTGQPRSPTWLSQVRSLA
jgi:hypothetical protein